MPGHYFGKYTGIVKDNRDQSMLGLLQLSVPAIFPPQELVTARAALPYGYFFVPENEAKVWVEFEGGDPELPLWTGIQYVSGEWAAEAAVDPPQRRVLKTAAGHFILFRDKQGEEAIEITDGVNKHVITLDQKGIKITDGVSKHVITLDQNGIGISDGVSKHGVTLDQSGIKITDGVNKHEITLAAAGVTLESKADVTIKGANVTIEATAQLTAKGKPIHLNP